MGIKSNNPEWIKKQEERNKEFLKEFKKAEYQSPFYKYFNPDKKNKNG